METESELPGLSLKGKEGDKVIDNISKLAGGVISLSEVNDPRYTFGRDPVTGMISVEVELDEESFALFDD